jgi:3'(2'), 5'-bisphosphate nucleotidase / inositol polyphosphate 1-phosphatase
MSASGVDLIALPTADIMLHLLPGAKRAVIAAARLAASVQAEVLSAKDRQATSKLDASPVTIGDFGAQCVFGKLVQESLGDIRSVAPQLKDLTFRLLAEEEAATLAAADHHLQAAVANAVNRSLAAEGQKDVGLPEVLTLLDAGRVDESNEASVKQGYFILDPIDGTKGFLRQGQWAVGCAFLQQGRPVLSIIACPNLPYRSEGSGKLSAVPAVDHASGQVGSLFFAVEGEGAFVEPLPDLFSPSSASSPVAARRIHVNEDVPIASAVYAESFERGHSDSSMTTKVARAAGVDTASTPVIRCDSMVKYCE